MCVLLPIWSNFQIAKVDKTVAMSLDEGFGGGGKPSKQIKTENTWWTKSTEHIILNF